MSVRWLFSILSCAAALAAVSAPATAASGPTASLATEQPLRFVSRFYPQPYEPNATEPTSLVVLGWFPYPCGVVTDTAVVGDRLELTLRPATGCDDSAATWSHVFRLGTLAAGSHTLTLRVTCVTPESTIVGERAFPLEVFHLPPPPPPPPPQEPPSWLLRCLSGWSTEPDPPTENQPTTLWLSGWFPYPCGEIEAHMITPERLEITLRRRESCGGDTAMTWRHPFPLGTLPEGLHQLMLEMVVRDDPADSLEFPRQAYFGFPIHGDSTGPPPPPPPGAGPLRFVSSIATEPVPPLATQPTSLRASGWFPFACGMVTDTAVVGDRLELTLRSAAGCPDSATGWTHRFRLGMVAAGQHLKTLRVTCVTAESTIVGEQALTLEVLDAPPPPPPPPQEPPSWLLRCLSGWSTEPASPTENQPTTLWLSGWFPYPCGEIEAHMITTERLEITLRRRESCGGDTAMTWRHAFPLGTLPEGLHQLMLEMVVRDDPADSLELPRQAYLGFPVYGDFVPPPPPPPPPPPSAEHPLRFVSGISIDPVRPRPDQPTSVVFDGWFPYSCGEVTDARVVGLERLELTLRPATGCADTAAPWTQRFDLGTLAEGVYPVRLVVTCVTPESTTVGERDITVEVRSVWEDPPPPPNDSLLSPGHPNPFVEATEFSVRMDREARTAVQIYDIGGRLVTSVFDGTLAAGTWRFRWDGKRSDGTHASTGIYFCRVAFGNHVLSRRLVMLRKR